MAYARTGYGPGSIGVLQSGAALSYGPTIGSNDPTSPQGVGGSMAAYTIPSALGSSGFYEAGMGSESMLSRVRRLFGGRTAGQAHVMAVRAPAIMAAMRPGMIRMTSDTNLESTIPPPIDEGLPTEDMQLTSLETAPSPWPWVIGGVLLLGAIGGGAWYFLKYRKQEE